MKIELKRGFGKGLVLDRIKFEEMPQKKEHGKDVKNVGTSSSPSDVMVLTLYSNMNISILCSK